MTDVAKSVQRDDFMRGNGLNADGALAVEGTMMAAGFGGVVIINPGVSLVRRVLLASDKVRFAVCVGFEWF